MTSTATEQRRDRGTMTPWMLAMTVLILALGGLGLDLWRAVAERRGLQEVAEASSRAGANGIDEAAFDESGELVLDPGRAEDLARDNLSRQDPLTLQFMTDVRVSSTTERVTVEIDGSVETVLTRLLGADAIEVSVVADAAPRAQSTLEAQNTLEDGG
jgi:Flp pilus assembly protein TadG